MKQKNRVKNYWPGITISLIFLIINLFTINDYGVTWDEHAHFEMGDKNINFFKTGIILTVNNWEGAKRRGPFFNTFSSLSKIIFYDKLKCLDELSARNLPIIILASITIFVCYLFSYRAFGKQEALIASICLSLMPRFIGHAHNNIKDLPALAFMTISVWMFWEFTKTKKLYWLILSGLVLGWAMNIKLTSIFIFIIIGIWYLIIKYKEIKEKTFSCYLKYIINDLNKHKISLFPLTTILSLIVFWPWLWSNTLNKLKEIFLGFYSNYKGLPVYFFGKEYISSVNVPRMYAPTYLLITTPLIILTLFFLGIFHLSKIKNKEYINNSILIILFLFIPIIRYIIKSIAVYDGIRHYLEVIVPLCIIAGIGGTYLIKTLKKYFKTKNRLIPLIIIIILFLPLLILNISLHPNQIVFLNKLAKINGPLEDNFDLDYWGNSYKAGSYWLNKNAAENSTIILPIAGHIPQNYLKNYFKLVKIDALKKYNNGFKEEDLLKKLEPNTYVMYITRKTHYDYLINYLENNSKPVFEIEELKSPILKIYKIS